ncbi:MAG: CDP-alcohol phosphatidyltransferase family protein [Lachnospiraceae bacterium]
MKNIPNILTGFRILLIPFFVWQMLRGHLLNAGGILILSGITDLLDGYLARRFHWVSQLGKVLDPIADKLTHAAICILFIIKLRQFWPFFVIILGKDLIILILGASLLKKKVKVQGAKMAGKVSTTVFYLVAILLILIPGIPKEAAIALLSLATLCSLVAGFSYIPDYIKYRSQARL